MPLPFPDKTIHQFFEEQAEQAPEKIALIFEEQKLTYRELNERANQLAHYLKKHHDFKPDTLIGMSLKRGVECIVSLLAILKTGGAYVPLDPDYPKEHLQFMLQDTNIDIILTRENFVRHLPVIANNKVPQIIQNKKTGWSIVLTVWTAWTECTKENGCLKFQPDFAQAHVFRQNKSFKKNFNYDSTGFYGYTFAA